MLRVSRNPNSAWRKFALSISLFMPSVCSLRCSLITCAHSSFPNSQEELPGLLKNYERRGHFDEVISLLEAALSLERAHVSGS